VIIVIKKSDHNFFDNLVTFLFSYSSAVLAFELFKNGRLDKGNDYNFSLTAIHSSTNLGFRINSLFAKNPGKEWPEEIAFEETPLTGKPRTKKILSPLDRVLRSLAYSMFIDYYERFFSSIGRDYPGGIKVWPKNWVFARIIRNTVYTGDLINFRHPSIEKVDWKDLTISRDDHGKTNLHRILSEADLIYLMLDMDRHLATNG
jgi:hypothetical protein